MIQISCPKCKKQYRFSEKVAGKKAKCSDCGQVIAIPAANASGASAARSGPPESPPAAPAPIGTAGVAPGQPAAPVTPAPQNAVPQARPIPQQPPALPPAIPQTPTVQPISQEPLVAQPIDDGIPMAEPIGQAFPVAPAQGHPPAVPPAQPIAAAVVPPDPAAPANFAAAADTAGVAARIATQAAALAQSQEANQVLRGTSDRLSYEIFQRPDFSIVKVDLPSGGQIFAEPSVMVSMTPNIHLKAGFKGGLGKTLGRMLGGESLIVNTFTSENGNGEILFAGGAAGDIAYYRLNGNTLYLQRGAYMLNTGGVDVSGKWGGAKGFFSGKGLVMLKASGTGDLFFNSYGAILPIDVTGSFIVDTGYVVAFEDSLQYNVTTMPGLRMGSRMKSFFFGGEGLVCQFAGHGRVWIQTRHVQSFLSFINPYRPVNSN